MILSRYVAKTILQTTFMMLVALMGLTLFLTLISQLGDIGKGDYDIFEAFLYALLQLPSALYQFFPMIGLIGTLLGLSVLAGHSELVVMRASGMSVQQLFWSVCQVVLLCVLLVTLVGETLAPTCARLATQRKLSATTLGQAYATDHGAWVKEGDSFFYIDRILPGRELRDVSRYQFNDSAELKAAGHADKAHFHKGHWTFHHIIESTLSEKGVEAAQYDKAAWRLHLPPGLLQIAAGSPDQMSLWKLHRLLRYQHRNSETQSAYQLSFWQRVWQPLADVVMMLLAVPFVFGPLRGSSLGFKMLVGVSAGFAFYLLNKFLGPFALVYQMPVVFTALAPSLLFGCLGLLLMRRRV